MDTSHIISILEKFFPVLIFLVWLFISVLANTKKRGPTGRAPEKAPSERTEYERSTQSEEQGSQISNDLKRTLETIFNEKKQENAPEPQPVPEPEEKDEEEENPDKQEDKTDLEKQVSIQRAFEEAQKKAETETGAQPVAAMMVSEPETQEPFLLSSDDLRKGIIWSEILAPPVSMRNS